MRIRAAAAQIAPELDSADGTVDKVLETIDHAADQGVDLIVFPEALVPYYPYFAFVRPPVALAEEHLQLYEDAISVPGPETEAIAAQARRYGMVVVLGVTERDHGSLYNTQLVFDTDGRLLLKRRKLMPSFHERLVWGQGDAAGLKVVETEYARVGALACWEHGNPLARYALMTQHEEIHCAQFPGSMVGQMFADQIDAAIRHHALEAGSFVISATGWLSDRQIRSLTAEPGLQRALRGGCHTAIVSPEGLPLAPTLREGEGLVVADLDMNLILQRKRLMDSVGHFARPELLALAINDLPATPTVPLASAAWRPSGLPAFEPALEAPPASAPISAVLPLPAAPAPRALPPAARPAPAVAAAPVTPPAREVAPTRPAPVVAQVVSPVVAPIAAPVVAPIPARPAEPGFPPRPAPALAQEPLFEAPPFPELPSVSGNATPGAETTRAPRRRDEESAPSKPQRRRDEDADPARVARHREGPPDAEAAAPRRREPAEAVPARRDDVADAAADADAPAARASEDTEGDAPAPRRNDPASGPRPPRGASGEAGGGRGSRRSEAGEGRPARPRREGPGSRRGEEGAETRRRAAPAEAGAAEAGAAETPAAEIAAAAVALPAATAAAPAPDVETRPQDATPIEPTPSPAHAVPLATPPASEAGPETGPAADPVPTAGAAEAGAEVEPVAARPEVEAGATAEAAAPASAAEPAAAAPGVDAADAADAGVGTDVGTGADPSADTRPDAAPAEGQTVAPNETD